MNEQFILGEGNHSIESILPALMVPPSAPSRQTIHGAPKEQDSLSAFFPPRVIRNRTQK